MNTCQWSEDPEPMIKHAEFSECGKYRYLLTRVWDATLKPAVCIGLNPSTTNASEDDPTIKNLCTLLESLGYGALYMMNLYGIISADPKILQSNPNPIGENDLWIDKITPGQDVIFAWGAFKQAEYRAKKMIAKLPDALCLGKTATGKPIHPLAATVWMKSKCKLQRFK
jgi:hypothetical protein